MNSGMTLKMLLLGEDRSMSKAVKGAGAATEDVGKKFDGMAKVAAFGLAGMGTAAVVVGVKAAAMNEQAQVAFTTLLGSGKKAQGFLAQLNTFAANTPFDLPGLIDSSRLLLGVGMDAKKVIPTLTAWGDAAGALGISQDGFNHSMIAVSQSLSAGRINAGDMNQIVQAGIPIWKLMSEATGKTVPELRKLSQQGKLLSGDVLPLLNKQMEKDYGGSMAKQSKTLNGLWSTLMDTFSQGMAQAIVPMIPLLKQGLTNAISALPQILPMVVLAFTRVGQAIKVAANFIRQATQFYMQHRVVLNGVLVVLGTAIGMILAVRKVIQAWSVAQAVLNAVMAANPIGIVVVALAALAAGLIYAYKNSATFRNIVDGAFRAIGAIARWLWNTIFAPLFRFLINGFATVADWIGNMLDALGHIPGFGWARDAAAKMHGAAAAARNLASNIRDIPDGKSVSVVINTYYKTHGTPQPGAGNLAKGYASGGFNLPAGWAMVGERGPELMYVPGGASIVPAQQTARVLAGGRSGGSLGGGGDINLTVNLRTPLGRLIQQELLRLKRDTGSPLGLA